MSEFNENPFKKDTPVVPFSNGSEFENWQDNNCAECINYENESDNEEKAKCKLAFHLDYGTISGTIPLWVAKGIGCVIIRFIKLANCVHVALRCVKVTSHFSMNANEWLYVFGFATHILRFKSQKLIGKTDIYNVLPPVFSY